LCLVFRNEMGADFRGERLLFALDGSVVFDRDGDFARSDHVIYSGPSRPGEHTLQLLLRMRMGPFHFEARSSHAFDVSAGGPGADRVITVAYERAARLREERPAIRYIEEPATPRPRATTIWVSKSGDIALNGQPADMEAVGKALEDLSKQGKGVVFGMDLPENQPHPTVKKVLELLANAGLEVRLSSKPDFSDVLAADGTIRPSSSGQGADRTPKP
jgi:hypothetical protein